MRSINFADEAVEDFYLLFAGAVGLFDGFVYQDFLNQCVKQFCSQLGRVGVLTYQFYPLLGVCRGLLLGGELCFQSLNLLSQRLLLGLLLLREHIEVVLRDAACCPVLVHLGEQAVNLGLALFGLGQLVGLFL